MVSKQKSKVEEKGTHQKGPGSTGAQRPPSHVFRRADTRGRVAAQGTRAETEKVAQELGKTAEEVGGQRGTR